MGCFTGDFYAESLRMTTQVKVIFPDHSTDVDPLENGEPRLLYLLHGLSANAGEWTRFSKIEYFAKKYNLIVVMPEVQRSFYCDTAYGPRYFSYVADELPHICGQWFRLPQDTARTFIAGESMGGYGATKIALSRPEQYGAAASLSGVMDIAGLMRDVMAGNWPDLTAGEVKAIFGAEGIVPPESDLLHLVRSQAKNPSRPRLLQLCGTEDFLYPANQLFRHEAEAAGYGHTYLEGPGDHAWPYWDVAIQRAFQFFCGMDLESSPIY